ncbi:MAG: hypothetical protein A2075_10350 [Geobacteraceae bacterium GWC2_58_44]|nr:MAG: hypothetical protein A2075_10350 [Geobacteraceae bacterium GWC2_58_44]HBG04548.1 hypothetical protein [Geobacter sp.]
MFILLALLSQFIRQRRSGRKYTQGGVYRLGNARGDADDFAILIDFSLAVNTGDRRGEPDRRIDASAQKCAHMKKLVDTPGGRRYYDFHFQLEFS